MEQIEETSRLHDTGSVTKRRVAPRRSVLLAIGPAYCHKYLNLKYRPRLFKRWKALSSG